MRQLMLDLWLAGFQFVLGLLSSLFYFGCLVAGVLLVAGITDYVLYQRRAKRVFEETLTSDRRTESGIPTRVNGEKQ